MRGVKLRRGLPRRAVAGGLLAHCVAWWNGPAVPVPPAPPGRTRLASAYEARGSRVLGQLQIALLLTSVCVYYGVRDGGSMLAVAIVISCFLYWIIMAAHPAWAIAAGKDWLSVVPVSRGHTQSWVATNRLAELRLDDRSQRWMAELSDSHGRTVKVSLRDLRSNQLLHALFVRAVRQSQAAGMRIDETAGELLSLEMPVLGDEIGVDRGGRPVVTYFAFHLVKDGPGEPIVVIRRTPGDPFPTDETIDEHGRWRPDGYLYQVFGIPEGFAITRITERRALAFVDALRAEVVAEDR